MQLVLLTKSRILWTKILQQFFSVILFVLHFTNSLHLYRVSGLVNFTGSVIFLITLKYLKRKWILMFSAFVMGTALTILGQLLIGASKSANGTFFRILPIESGRHHKVLGILDLSLNLHVLCSNWALLNTVHVHCGNVST